jgi:F-type H+-transporting ATPase subunit gamma
VGQFNDVVADYAVKTLAALPGKPEVWAVGERVQARLADAGVPLMGLFSVPNSVQAITPLVGQIQIESEARRAKGEYARLYIFHNRPKSGALYEPVGQRLLPFDAAWQQGLAKVPWPTKLLPEVRCGDTVTLRALLREYLFISLFRACAESLASENASRLAAMERADKNIDELLETLHGNFHRIRQTGIDEELFDVISGFEAHSKLEGMSEIVVPLARAARDFPKLLDLLVRKRGSAVLMREGQAVVTPSLASGPVLTEGGTRGALGKDGQTPAG